MLKLSAHMIPNQRLQVCVVYPLSPTGVLLLLLLLLLRYCYCCCGVVIVAAVLYFLPGILPFLPSFQPDGIDALVASLRCCANLRSVSFDLTSFGPADAAR
jgi:hypothetical protein